MFNIINISHFKCIISLRGMTSFTYIIPVTSKLLCIPYGDGHGKPGPKDSLPPVVKHGNEAFPIDRCFTIKPY